MVRSMTGYGQGEVQAPGGACAVEVRSLNHRYCEIAVKTPRGFAALENRIRETVRSRFARGRFDVHVTVNYAMISSRRIVIDQVLARSAFSQRLGEILTGSATGDPGSGTRDPGSGTTKA